MTSQVYRVLLIANRESDRHLIRNLCNSINTYQLELDWIGTEEELDRLLGNARYDLYLIDFDCFPVEKITYHSLVPAIALINNSEEIELVLDAGVTDYLEKEQLTSRELDRSIRLTLQNAMLQKELQACQQDRIELISLQQQLEQKVRERTADLAKINRELHQEIRVRQEVEDALRESETKFRQLAENIESVEERLRFSEECYTLAINSSKVGVWDWNMETNAIYLSPNLKAMLGYEDDEIPNQIEPWGNLVHPDDRERVWSAVTEHLEGKTPVYEVEHRMLHKDGSIRWLLGQGKVYRDANGKAERMAGSDTDITAIKQAEAQWKQKNHEMAALLAAFPDLLFRLNSEGIILDYQAREDLDLYVPKEQFLGKSFVEILPAAVAQKNWQGLKQAIETNSLVSIEYSLAMGDRTQYYEARIVPLQQDELISVVRNISDRKEAETALQNSEERFRTIFEQAAIGIARMDFSGNFIQLNQRFCDIVGYAESELLGRNFAEVSHPDDIELCRKNIAKILSGEKKTCSMQKRYLRKNLQVQWVNSSVSVVLDYQGVPQYLLIVLQDIQEQKRVEEKLQYRLKLETALARISQELAVNENPDIDNILEIIGVTVGASRAYLIRFVNQTRGSMIHEWCDSETPSDRDKFQNVDLSIFSWWMDKINNRDGILIFKVEELPPEAAAEQQYLKSVGVNSVLAIPLYDRCSGQVWGNIGFDTSGNNFKQWSVQDAQILGIVGEILSSYYSRLVALDRLRSSEALYEGIFNYSAEAIFLIDVLPDGRFVYETVNPTYQELTGISLQDCLGKTPSEVFCAEIAAREAGFYRDCIDFAETIDYQQTLELPVGKRIWRTSLVPIADETNKIVKLQGSARDITREKERDDLQKQQLTYQQLLTFLTLKIRQSLQIQDILETAVTELQKTLNLERVLFLRLFADRSGRVINEVVVPSYPKMLHEERVQYFCLEEDLLTQNQEELIQVCSDVLRANFPADRREFLEQYQIKAYVMLPILVANLDREQEIFNNSSLSPPSEKNDRTIWGILCVHQCSQPREWQPEEIGLLCQFTAQLSIAIYQAELLKQQNIQRQKLARSNAELEQFAYIASHDLQEPLQTITSYAKFFQRRYQSLLDSKANKFISYIIDGSERMQTLINDLHQYSRLDRQNKPLMRADCNILFEQAIANLKITIIKQQATVIATKLPILRVDAEQIVQLFQNLIANAIKYRSQKSPIVRVSAQSCEGFWLFSIEDNGIGIDPQHSKRIFQIFQRLHSEAEYPGTGIGLAICEKIVRRHGGSIWVESELERGSTFHFTIQDLESVA